MSTGFCAEGHTVVFAGRLLIIAAIFGLRLCGFLLAGLFLFNFIIIIITRRLLLGQLVFALSSDLLVLLLLLLRGLRARRRRTAAAGTNTSASASSSHCNGNGFCAGGRQNEAGNRLTLTSNNSEYE
jgi:hypothetical protein